MADLRTDYKDDVLDTSKNEKRKYNLIQNEDGTVSLEDVTEYLQEGDSYGAVAINEQNTKINEIDSSLCRYNPDTDSFDIYSDGVLVGSIFCGFQWNGVIFNGTFDKSSGITSYEKTAYDGNLSEATEVTVSDNKINLNVKSHNNTTYVIASPNQKVSLANYSKLTITGTVTSGVSDTGARGYVGIGTQLPTSTSIFNSLKTTLLGTQPKSVGTTNFTKTIDISSFNDEPVYIALYVQSTNTGNRAVSMAISSIVCSN